MVQTAHVRTLEDDDRCGRMVTTIIPQHVSVVEALIKQMYNALKYRMSRRFHREVSLALFSAASAQGNIVPVVCPKTPVKSRSGLAGWMHQDLHAKKMLRRKVSSRLGHLNGRRNLYIPIKPRDEATLGGMGLPRCVPTYEFQKKQKCFKIYDSV